MNDGQVVVGGRPSDQGHAHESTYVPNSDCRANEARVFSLNAKKESNDTKCPSPSQACLDHADWPYIATIYFRRTTSQMEEDITACNQEISKNPILY